MVKQRASGSAPDSLLGKRPLDDPRDSPSNRPSGLRDVVQQSRASRITQYVQPGIIQDQFATLPGQTAPAQTSCATVSVSYPFQLSISEPISCTPCYPRNPSTSDVPESSAQMPLHPRVCSIPTDVIQRNTYYSSPGVRTGPHIGWGSSMSQLGSAIRQSRMGVAQFESPLSIGQILAQRQATSGVQQSCVVTSVAANQHVADRWSEGPFQLTSRLLTPSLPLNPDSPNKRNQLPLVWPIERHTPDAVTSEPAQSLVQPQDAHVPPNLDLLQPHLLAPSLPRFDPPWPRTRLSPAAQPQTQEASQGLRVILPLPFEQHAWDAVAGRILAGTIARLDQQISENGGLYRTLTAGSDRAEERLARCSLRGEVEKGACGAVDGGNGDGQCGIHRSGPRTVAADDGYTGGEASLWPGPVLWGFAAKQASTGRVGPHDGVPAHTLSQATPELRTQTSAQHNTHTADQRERIPVDTSAGRLVSTSVPGTPAFGSLSRPGTTPNASNSPTAIRTTPSDLAPDSLVSLPIYENRWQVLDIAPRLAVSQAAAQFGRSGLVALADADYHMDNCPNEVGEGIGGLMEAFAALAQQVTQQMNVSVPQARVPVQHSTVPTLQVHVVAQYTHEAGQLGLDPTHQSPMLQVGPADSRLIASSHSIGRASSDPQERHAPSCRASLSQPAESSTLPWVVPEVASPLLRLGVLTLPRGTPIYRYLATPYTQPAASVQLLSTSPQACGHRQSQQPPHAGLSQEQLPTKGHSLRSPRPGRRSHD